MSGDDHHPTQQLQEKPVLAHIQNTEPSTTRFPRVPSAESLHYFSGRSQPLGAGPALKKRHSTFHISPRPEQPPSPVPVFPPQRPPRNPARSTSSIIPEEGTSNPSSRPSTATTTFSREDVTPWEFQSTPPEEKPPAPKAQAVSIRSRASSAGMGFTGPIEEVTPWELVPPPLPLLHSTRSLMDNKPPSTSPPPLPPPPASAPLPNTGPVDEVTPWELYPEPIPVQNQQNDPSDSPVITPTTQSHATATGPAEDVTPWDLYPTPAQNQPSTEDGYRNSRGARSSLSLTKTKVEEVTPWELYPAPVPEVPSRGPVSQKASMSSNRPSSSSGPNKSLTELGLVRRRRSTGNKARSIVQSSSHGSKQHKTGEPKPSHDRPTSIKSHSETSPRTSPTTSRFSLKGSSANHNAAPHSYDTLPPSHAREEGKFSTADRTILEELKRNLQAKEALFKLRGLGLPVENGGSNPGKKHHCYPDEEAPYPRCYERELVDLDNWETAFCQNICDSTTWHVFTTPPARVLDLGCGSGTWILNCARTWKETQFVGLDIVPLHPDLQQVGSSDLASRITWVHHNFLEGLPFPDGEFDFVHIKRIALGVPEHKWDRLFEEIERVMKPGAAFEMLEEDLFFPGKPIDESIEESDIESNDGISATRRNSTASDTQHHASSQDQFAIFNGRRSEDAASLSTPTPASTFAPRPSQESHGPLPIKRRVSSGVSERDYSQADVPPIPVSSHGNSDSHYKKLTTHHSRSAARPMLHLKTNGSPRQSYNFAESAVSIMGAMGYFPPPPSHSTDPSAQPKTPSKQKRSSSIVTTPITPPSLSEVSRSENQSLTEMAFTLEQASQKDDSEPPSTPSSPPWNPRDHSVLEMIYNEMLASRFINTSPLSLLNNYLEYYFKDVRTHPPLLFTFPPSISAADEQRSPTVHINSSNLSAPNNASAHSVKIQDRLESYPPRSSKEVTSYSLVRHASPYITIDDSRSYAFSPASKTVSSSTGKSREAHLGRISNLPNSILHIDVNTLHLHLTLRVKEILGCSEPMWEWVVDYQAQLRAEKSGRSRAGSIENHHTSSAGPSASFQDSDKNILEVLTRQGYDRLLYNFTHDMQDQASLGKSVEQTFSWSVFKDTPKERDVFNKALEGWEKWNAEQGQSSSSHPYQHQDQPQSRNTIPNSHTSSVAHSLSQGSANAVMSKDSDSIEEDRIPPNSLKPDVPKQSEHLSLSNQLDMLPTQRLSRAVRVFVGWKSA